MGCRVTRTETTDDKYALRSVSRALDVLQALAASGGDGMSVGEIAEAVGVSRSTAFTLLQTLVARGYVSDVRFGGARRYQLGLTLIHLGDRAQAEMAIARIAMPTLQQLTEATGLTSRLAVFDDGCAVAVARVDAPGPFRLVASLGRRELPHSSAVGKSLLLNLSEDEVLSLLHRLGMPRRTEKTITTPQDLVRNLKEVRNLGYAFDDEEDMIGVACVGAGIYGPSKSVVAAMSVTGIKHGRGLKELHELGMIVRTHADQVSLLLGGPTHTTYRSLTNERE